MSEGYLEQLHATLQRIADLVPATLADWQSDEVRRLAVERLWITAGNLAEARRIPRTGMTSFWSQRIHTRTSC